MLLAKPMEQPKWDPHRPFLEQMFCCFVVSMHNCIYVLFWRTSKSYFIDSYFLDAVVDLYFNDAVVSYHFILITTTFMDQFR